MAQESRLAVTIDSRGAKRNADDLTGSLQQMEKAGDAVAASTDGVSDSLSDQRKALSQLLGKIDPSVAALGRLDEMQAQLSKYRKAGIVESDTFVEYTKRIDTMREALGETSTGMNRAGLSAKQMNNSLRMLPAQFSDIAISLQAGQSPMTVFLQQGAQIKDSFGGVGPALGAVGGYALSLVTPFTMAASAVGLLGVAAYKGHELAEQYRKALTLTGESAGRTADELISLSTALARGRNFSEANQAVLALAGNGRLAGEAFREVARAATEVSVATGKSSAEIVDQLSSEKVSVTDLAAEYSEKYGVITQAVFTQVRSLELQGQHMEAVRVLAGAVADEMSQRNKEMVESTRGLAAAWDGVKSSVSEAWNELKTGLSASPELFRLQHLQQQLQTAQEIGDKALIAGLETQIQLAQKAVDAQSEKAKVAAAELRDRKVSVAAEKSWYDTGKKYQTDEQKRDADIAKARKQGLEAKKSEAEIEKRIAEIRDEYAKKQPKARSAPQNRGVAEAENTFARLYAQYDPASQAARALTKEQQQLDLAFKKGKISQEEYGKALAQASTNYAAAIKGAQGLTQAEQYRAQMERQLATQRMEYAAQADAVGMGQKDATRMQERLRIEQDTNNRILQLQTELANAQGEKQRQDLQAQIDIEREFLQKRVAAQREGWAQIDQAQADWSNGARGAFQDYMDSARDVAGQTRNLFSNAFGNMEDAVVNFVKTGKLSFKDFADQVVADLIRIQVRQAAAGFLGSALGFLGGGGGAAAAGSGTMTGFSETISRSGFAAGGYTGDGGKFEPKGVVHGGEYVVRKEVVSQPGMRDHLDRLNRKGYASGGYVEPAGVPAQGSTPAPSASSGLPPIIQHISVQGSADEATLARIQQAAQKGAQDGYNLVLRDLKTNGPARQLIARR